MSEEETAPTNSAVVGAAPAGAAGRILVVDDDEGNRQLLERRLSRLGHHVRSAIHGAEALELLRSVPCDLVLLDIQMPVMDGEQTLRILRADPDFQRPPVIVLPASRELCRVGRFIRLGAGG